MDQKETKYACMDRLRRQGVWQQACKFRQSRIRQHRESGMRMKEARAKAWEEMRVEYPAPDPPPGDESGPAAPPTPPHVPIAALVEKAVAAAPFDARITECCGDVFTKDDRLELRALLEEVVGDVVEQVMARLTSPARRTFGKRKGGGGQTVAPTSGGGVWAPR